MKSGEQAGCGEQGAAYRVRHMGCGVSKFLSCSGTGCGVSKLQGAACLSVSCSGRVSPLSGYLEQNRI